MTTEPNVCRVCHSEEEPTNPLWSPCRCTGSMKWIHRECLTQWATHCQGRLNNCETCQTPYDSVVCHSSYRLRWDIVGRMIGAGTLMLVLVAFFCYLNGVIIPLYEDKWSCRFPWVLLHGMNNICMYMLYIGIVKIWSLSDELYEKANLVLTWNPLPPNELVLHVQEPWFSAIRAGTKTVEGRKGGATKFERYCGRPITFVNGNASVTKRVYRLLYYPGLQSFLAANPNALPGVTDRNKQLEIYHQFYSDDDIAKAGGFTAIEWE